MKRQNLLSLYLRWVAANGVGEMFGLGGTFLVLSSGLPGTESMGGVSSILVAFGFAIITGIFEATLVGLLQWQAMHPWFPNIRRTDWLLATVIGALAAYFLGFLPSTVFSLQAEATAAAGVTEPPQAIVLLLAAGLGLAGGAILSFAQWRVLRKQVKGAGIWLPFNMLAWILGMPLIFWAIDAGQRLTSKGQLVLLIAALLLMVGLIVGAVHGLGLVQLAHNNPITEKNDAAPSI